jgi:hypothetical protein
VRNLPKALLALASTFGVADADPSRCAQTGADLKYSVNDIPTYSGDTGWFPSGEAAQLRISGRISGTTSVAMSLAPSACWDQAMAVTVPGQPQTGVLDSEYGAELTVQGKIHVSVLGQTYDWQGNVPLPQWFPNNLLMAGTTTFDPTVLPGSSQTNVSVTSNPTSEIEVMSTDVLSQFVDIPGVGGKIYIAISGQTKTSYHTTAIAVGSGSITQATGAVNVTAPETGFAGSLAQGVSATGVVHYDPVLTFHVHFEVTILGISVSNWEIASVSMTLPGFDRDVTLKSQGMTFQLPYLAKVPTSLGFADGATQTLTLHNAGGAPLAITIASLPEGVTASSITIPAGADGGIQVTASDPSALGSAPLMLASNDPDHPEISVALDASGHGQQNEGGEHSGGCSAGGGEGLGLVVLVLGVALAGGRVRRRS